MECRVCGVEISDETVFCSFCGSKTAVDQDEMEIIEEAVDEAEKVFDAEMEEIEELVDESADDGDAPETTDSSEERKTAAQRFREIRNSVKEKTDNAIEFGRKVSDSTSRAVQKGKEVHADVTHKVGDATDKTIKFGRKVSDTTSRAVQKGKEVHADVTHKVGDAVDKTKEISEEVGVHARKVGTGVRKAVRKTKDTVDELGQVGVIITQRALDVVRASLRAIEIVDDFLDKKQSPYEVGNFITGVGIPPYLEIEFTKRSTDITNEERKIIQMFRDSDFSVKTLDDVQALLKKGRQEDPEEDGH